MTKTDTWQTRPLVREGAPKNKTITLKKRISGQMSQIWAWHQDILTDWPSAAMWLWLWQIQRSGFDSQHYQVFWEVVGLERGPLSLVSTTEELLGRKSSGSGLETSEYDRRDPSRWARGTLYPQKLALTSPTSCYWSIGIVRSWTQATEYSILVYI
jgi:hypothetical protein